MNKEKVAQELMLVAKDLLAGYKSDFYVRKPLILDREGGTRFALSNARKIKEAGYSIVDGTYTWDSTHGKWEMAVNFIDDTGTSMATHIFLGFSVGYGGEGPTGFMEFGKIFGIRFDEKKILEHGVLPPSGKDVPLSNFQ